MKNSGSDLLLDTNAISDLAEYLVAADRVRRMYARTHIPLFVYAEYRAGILGSIHREKMDRSFEKLLRHADVLFPDATTADHYAIIFNELKKKGRPIPTNDIWIAALARQHGLPIMTRDTHFSHIDAVNTIGW